MDRFTPTPGISAASEHAQWFSSICPLAPHMPVYTYHPLNSFFLSLAFTAWGADTDESVTCHAEINPDSMQIINSLNVFCRPHSEAEARKNWIFTNLSTFLILVKHLNAVKAYYIFRCTELHSSWMRAGVFSGWRVACCVLMPSWRVCSETLHHLCLMVKGEHGNF